MAAHVRDGYGAFRQPEFECDCCEMLVFMICCVRQNLHVFSLYHNPDVDDRIFDCLLASMATVQTQDVRAFFLFAGDLNDHHQECWVLRQRTVVELQPLTSQLCDQLVVGPTHALGDTLDLLMTDVPDIVRVAAEAQIGNSDHSCLSAVISMAPAVPNLCVSGKVFLKLKYWLCMVKYGICPGVTFCLLTILLRL